MCPLEILVMGLIADWATDWPSDSQKSLLDLAKFDNSFVKIR
jgi:hypothetical protein